MKKDVQGYTLLLLEEEKNLLGMLLDTVSVPGKYAEPFVAIRSRFNAMKLGKIGTEEKPAAKKKRPIAPKAHPSVKAKKKRTSKKKRTR